ncbi:hypothetical protein [Methylorubrum podarium]|uniref:hypothetical protein n=1 Tax=Methylorubrum podarium TaxID=200476 RepID=UPI001EE2438D|nr:hypothetical protein [Methylorubrum podarium]
MSNVEHIGVVHIDYSKVPNDVLNQVKTILRTIYSDPQIQSLLANQQISSYNISFSNNSPQGALGVTRVDNSSPGPANTVFNIANLGLDNQGKLVNTYYVDSDPQI